MANNAALQVAAWELRLTKAKSIHRRQADLERGSCRGNTAREHNFVFIPAGRSPGGRFTVMICSQVPIAPRTSSRTMWERGSRPYWQVGAKLRRKPCSTPHATRRRAAVERASTRRAVAAAYRHQSARLISHADRKLTGVVIRGSRSSI